MTARAAPEEAPGASVARNRASHRSGTDPGSPAPGGSPGRPVAELSPEGAVPGEAGTWVVASQCGASRSIQGDGRRGSGLSPPGSTDRDHEQHSSSAARVTAT